MFQKAVKILKATVGIRTNHKDLLPTLPPCLEVPSLLTDFRRVEEIKFKEGLDGYIYVEDAEEDPVYDVTGGIVNFKGPFLRMKKEASDPRYTLWGNQGFLYRYVLYLLEKKHGFYNFHACALYQKKIDKLFVIIGSAGSGKTVYLLSGLEKGLKLVSTETVHLRMEGDDLFWHMGSMADNVRYGNLVHDFPRFLPRGEIPDPAHIWQKKIALDLSPYRVMNDTKINPRYIHILFPRIEIGFENPSWESVKNTREAEKILFDNITEKLAETVLLYDNLAVLGLDEKGLSKARLRSVRKLANHRKVTDIQSVISDPRNCWGNLLE